MRLSLPLGLLVATLQVSCSNAPSQNFTLNEHGVVVHPTHGTAKHISLSVLDNGIFHVVSRDDANRPVPDSLMVVDDSRAAWQHDVTGNTLTISTDYSRAAVALDTGKVTFYDAEGKPLLQQSKQPTFTPVEVEGQPFVAVSQQFNAGSSESFYGLGQHQNGQMDFNGEDLELLQHNIDIGIPMVVSNAGYGVLWDNNSISRFGNPAPYRLVGDGLKVSADGQTGWSASYYLNDKLAVQRQEATINYQYIRDQQHWPEAAKATTVAADSGQNTAGNAVQTQRVVWRGDVTADETGVWKFQLYGSSYFKLYANDELILDRWRQNWNPWYHNFELPLEADKPVAIRIEWEPNAGYMSLHYNRPLPAADRHSLWFSSDVAQAVNYYFIPGQSIDDVIAGYRQLTGKAVMLPKWAYGFWQSRQRYHTQQELLDVVATYRELNIPLDNIVQDWFYWHEDQWGSHEFDPSRFPDPKGMVDSVHAQNARFMISVWPKFYPNTDNFKAFEEKGYFYPGNLEVGEKDWVGPGYLNTDYDPYQPEARQLYWQQMKERLHVLGIDAWWMDATEPDIHSNLSLEERAQRMGPTAIGPGAEYFNSFPLVHGEGVFEGLMASQPDTRPFILTRAGWGGIQRTASALWSGDIVARWDDMAAQVAAGVNLSMAGIPNWTFDIGGFAVEDRYTREDPAHLKEWRELNLRWFQFGAFVPLFRSHGEYPFREVYNLSPEGSPMRDSMVWYSQLRYRLMPYIYTLAADTYHRDGSIMRGLAMDFDDPNVRHINDSYLFGPSLLVAPVASFGATSRPVYLPAGSDWYDFNSGELFEGGKTIDANAPFERMPVFVKAGSIIPMGPVMQYVDEIPNAPLIVDIWPGADGQFDLYEDDGVSMQYAQGAFSRLGLHWNDAAATLSIAGRQGSYPGMAQERHVIVRLHRAGQGVDAETEQRELTYSGQAVSVSFHQ